MKLSKMKKFVSAVIVVCTVITMVSCEKKVNVNAVSAILPGVQLSSVGMGTPGPYALPVLPSTATPAPVNVIQFIFGASTTNKTPGPLDVTIYDASVKPVNTVAVQTLHFNSWSANDTGNTPSYGSVGFTTVPSTYPNTTIYQGSILLKIPSVSTTYPLGSKLLTGKTYNVKIVASSADGITSTQTITNLFTIQ